jgi:SWI/SNF-related matrix-associated actin-dependent regulator of chromatin subfamily A-like protein 1
MTAAMNLRPYQLEGADFLADTSTKAALLGDEPGLGKTRQAIAAADTVGARKILVLCYAIAKSHWQREFQELQAIKRRVSVLTSQRDTLRDDLDLVVVVANYDLIQQRDQPMRNKLLKHRWDVLILDEAHVLKNPDAKKVRYVYGQALDGRTGLVSRAENVFVLTGTPMPNHAGELWTHFHALAPDLIPDPLRPTFPLSYLRYLDRYATIDATPWGNKITGSKNLQDLNKRLAPFMLRRRKKDVLKDLPPLDFTLYPLTLEAPPQHDHSLDNVDDDQLEHLLTKPGAISTVRRVLGEAKALPAVALAVSELEADPSSKIILFAHHLSVLDLMHQGFANAGHKVAQIDGRTNNATERDLNIDAFQHHPEYRVFLGQTTAAGTSITLHASSNVLIVEPSFVPKDNVQAASRAHRFGQKNSVLVRYLYVPDTLDERVIRILLRKTRAIATVLDDDIVNLGAPVSP